MFDDFRLETIELSNATLRVRHGGSGPAVMLLHGHPRTHTTWHKVAPLLSSSFTVVCPDLRGFGMSSKPEDTPDHSGSSKRAKALDCIQLMQHLGHERFAIVGHDRGAYTAFRAAMDHPKAIIKLAILDAVPILEALERCNEKFARLWWHWFFFGELEKPERAILADPDAWYRNTPNKKEMMGQEAYEDYHSAIHDPATVHGMIEDYRAGLGIDREHDAEDRRLGRKVTCPTLVLWSLEDDLEDLYVDVLKIWRPWTVDLQGFGINSGPHVAEASRSIPTEYRCNDQGILYYTENTENEEAMATKVSTAEFIRHFGRFHDQAQREPIVLTKHGRDTVVVLSKEEFERMQGNGDPRRVFALGETPADLAEVLLNGLDSQIAELEAKADE